VQYVRIASEADLLEVIGQPGAVLLSGGTDLLVKLRSGGASPDTLLDVSGIPSLCGMQWVDNALRIGAATPIADILDARDVVERLPLLSSVLQTLGSVQIRNRATLAGNLVNASPAADSAIALLLYDANVELVGTDGKRCIPVSELFVGPGKTALRAKEYVRSVGIPLPPHPHTSFFHKVGKRRALTIAIASVGSLLAVDDGRIVEARFAAGSVAPTPCRLRRVEEIVAGRTPTPDLVDDAITAAQANVSPIDDVRATAAYRRTVVGELVGRALRTAAAR